MNRRKGQNGTVVIQSGWYRVRWRMDIEGQEERIYMSEKVAPVVIDKDGNPKPASQAVQRLAREIVERSGTNSVEHFNRVVFGEVSFRDQTKEYLRWAGSRDRKRIKDLVSVEGDGCSAGWIAFKVESPSFSTSIEVVDLQSWLRKRPPHLAFLSIDIPIGLFDPSELSNE